MSVSTEQVKQLRERTGAGVLDCRKALEEAGGDLDQAELLIKQKGLAKMEARADRRTREGTIDLYSHGEGRMGVMVEVNCETDFVARTTEFRDFAHEMALQIAANAPRWVASENVPQEILEEHREHARQEASGEGKPENVIERIVEGKIEKFLDDSCLLRQPYVRDAEKSVEQILQGVILSTGENISIRRFERWELGQADA